MKNKKNTLLFLLMMVNVLVYAESMKLNIIDNLHSHEDFYINKHGMQSKYRIQMHFPHYSYYVDSKSCEYVECFPNFEMGIVFMNVNNYSIFNTENIGDKKYLLIRGVSLYIFPDIIMKHDNLKDVFSIKGTTREGGNLFNCIASYWEIYEKGLVLDIIYEKQKVRVCLELKDGKYYESENIDSFGIIRKRYSASDFLYDFWPSAFRYKFTYDGCSIYKVKGSKIVGELLDGIIFYNPTDTGIEFITPYGCGFFDFETESISLVPKEKYLGREFSYVFLLEDRDFKGGKARKIITEKDFNPPDIKIPLEEKDIRKNFNDN